MKNQPTERFRDFMKVVATLTMRQFVEQFPHPLLFYSKIPGQVESFLHTRLMDFGRPGENIDRFTEQILDFVPLLPNPHRNREFPRKAFVGRDRRRDFVIPHQTVSSRHACLMYFGEEEVFKVVDSGSTNGTFVRGRAIKPGLPVVLRDGDVIAFGQMTFLFFSPRGAYRYMRQYRLFREAMREESR